MIVSLGLERFTHACFFSPFFADPAKYILDCSIDPSKAWRSERRSESMNAAAEEIQAARTILASSFEE